MLAAVFFDQCGVVRAQDFGGFAQRTLPLHGLEDDLPLKGRHPLAEGAAAEGSRWPRPPSGLRAAYTTSRGMIPPELVTTMRSSLYVYLLYSRSSSMPAGLMVVTLSYFLLKSRQKRSTR